MLIYDKARLCGQGWLLNGGPTILYYFKNSKILVGEQMGQRQIALDIFFKKHELRLLADILTGVCGYYLCLFTGNCGKSQV